MTTLPDLGTGPPGGAHRAHRPRAASARRTEKRPLPRLLLLVGVLLLAGVATLSGWRLPGGPGLAGAPRPGVDVPSQPGPRSATPLGIPAPAPYGSGGYTFLSAHPDGSPVTFDPCRPVHYVTNRDQAPPEGDELLRWALGELTRTTGLRFVYDGDTDERVTADRRSFQPDRYGDRWAPVLVDWAGAQPDGALAADVLGRAGPLSFADGGEAPARFVSGVATFNGRAVQQLLDTGREDWARAVFLHELGHLVGLGHVEDPYQVMYGVNAAPVTSYRDGDRRGLELLGTGRCFRDY